jgi:hypothetical protein
VILVFLSGSELEHGGVVECDEEVEIDTVLEFIH